MKAQKLYTSFLIVVFTCFGIAVVAQPAWNVNANLYDYSMSVTGKVSIDGATSVDVNDMVAAFIGGECRGVINVKYQSTLTDYFVFLLIYSNNPTGSVSFKIYDASENKEIEVGSSVSFTVNGIVGSISNPYEFSGVTKTFEANILSFSIPDQEGGTGIATGNIYLTQATTGDLSNVYPSFTLSEGARAYVNDILQISGNSGQDFRNAVQYKIVPQVGDPNYYWVSISKAVDTSTKISISNTTVVENKDSVQVGVLSVESNVLGSSYAFSLAYLAGADNEMFYVIGDKLFVKEAVDFELNPKYKVNVKVANSGGISTQRTFDIDVLNQNDAPSGLTVSSNKISENTAINKLVARLSAADEDAGDAHVYSLKSGNGLNDEGNAYFAIQGDSLILIENISKLGKVNFKILVAVTDSSGASFEKEWSFQVVDINNPPLITTTPVAFAVQNQVYVYQVNVQDKEGDKVTVSFVDLPNWLTYNENTKLLSGVPVNDNVGDIQFKIKVSDGTKEIVQTVVISVLNVNDPPEIKQIPGTQYFYTSTENKIILPENMISDPDKGDKLTFLLSTENNSALPVWMVFDPVTMSISGTPPMGEKSIYNLKLTATDGAGLKEYLIIKLEVSISTAIDDQNKNDPFRIYPNPAADIININIPESLKTTNLKLQVTDMKGKILKNIEKMEESSQSLFVGDLPAGLYFVILQSDKSLFTEKIVKK